MTDILTSDQIARIQAVEHFRNSHDVGQDIGVLYLSYAAGYADLLKMYRMDQSPEVIADVGTGYGWLAIALARRTTARIIAIDVNEARLNAARRIATILDVEHRIEWRTGGLPDLPLTDREVDVTFCVEVIEHAGNRPEIVRELGRVTRDLLVISTPNRNFPVINHDTRLPFCHWLPLPIRTHYAALFGRKHLQEGNLFWSLAMISAALPDFERESRFLQFSTYRQFLAADRRVYRLANSFPPIGRVLRRYLLGISALIGRRSIHLLPNIASTFRRERNRQI